MPKSCMILCKVNVFLQFDKRKRMKNTYFIIISNF